MSLLLRLNLAVVINLTREGWLHIFLMEERRDWLKIKQNTDFLFLQAIFLFKSNDILTHNLHLKLMHFNTTLIQMITKRFNVF